MPNDTPPLLNLSSFSFEKTTINLDEIKSYQTESQFIGLAVELFKEVGIITNVLSCAFKGDANNTPQQWDRDEAILGGLMIRLTKLQSGFLDQVCQKRRELVEILSRCLAETIINLTYLLNGKSSKLFDEFVEYSLREEKRMLNRVNQNIKERGNELPIEKRIKKSIDRAFKLSLLTPEQVDESNYEPWGEKIYKRAKAAKIEYVYDVFSSHNHYVHGNWQDLLFHHIDDVGNRFIPKPDWSYIRPQPIFALAIFSVDVDRLYLFQNFPDGKDKKMLTDLLDDALNRIIQVDRLHEAFLQRS